MYRIEIRGQQYVIQFSPDGRQCFNDPIHSTYGTRTRAEKALATLEASA